MNPNLFQLIKKYDTSGPRYTSYPPAPVFSQSFGPADSRSEILHLESHQQARDVSLYFHIPFCDTLCYYCGCTTVITHDRTRINSYIEYLKREVDLLASLLNSQRRIVQMHWGGGTPTYLQPKEIIDLGEYILRHFTFTQQPEVSVEIDPRELSRSHLNALRDVGFNRMSLGVQDFDPRVQKAVNRVQSEFVTRQAINWIRDIGCKSLNVDLIYGLPLQTVNSFTETLDKIIDISPDRIAVYNFAYVPWMKKHQNVIHPEDLPSAETKIMLLTTTIEKLTDAGYIYVGMDHFAKPNDELVVAQQQKTLRRNFQGYSTKADSDLFGLGMSSIGHFGTVYAQNAKTIPEYCRAIDSGNFATVVGYRMTKDDVIRKDVIMQLMCNLVLNKAEVEQKYGVVFDDYFAESIQKLEPLIVDGLVELTSSGYGVTLPGRLFLRNIAMCFDAYVSTSSKSRPLYSKTI